MGVADVAPSPVVVAADVDEVGVVGEHLAERRPSAGSRLLQVLEDRRRRWRSVSVWSVVLITPPLERTRRTPVVNRKASQIRKPTPASPKSGMASPAAMDGPASVPTTQQGGADRGEAGEGPRGDAGGDAGPREAEQRDGDRAGPAR